LGIFRPFSRKKAGLCRFGKLQKPLAKQQKIIPALFSLQENSLKLRLQEGQAFEL